MYGVLTQIKFSQIKLLGLWLDFKYPSDIYMYMYLYMYKDTYNTIIQIMDQSFICK